MKTAEELVWQAKSAIAEGDYGPVCAALCEALGHLTDFSWRSGETWERDTVCDCCYAIGEAIYADRELEGLQAVYQEVRWEMKGVAARYLEHFWDGCGDGAWRG